MLAALDERHFATEAAYCLCHLHPNRPSAEHQQSARNGLHARHLAVGPNALELAQARDGRHDRVRSGGDHHVFGGVALPVDLDHACPGEPAAPAQQVDAIVRKPALLAGVGVVRNHEVTPGKRAVDVDLGARRRVTRGVHCLTWAQQRLRGDAGPVGALATDQLALDDRDPKAALRQLAGTVLSRRTAANHDDVKVGAHVGSSTPARSPTAEPLSPTSVLLISTSVSPLVQEVEPIASGPRLLEDSPILHMVD